MKVLVGRPLIDVAEIAEMELLILRRMREHTMGEHASVFRGPGSTSSGCATGRPATGRRRSTGRNRPSTTSRRSSCASSSSTAPPTIVVVADRSASTLCSLNGVSIRAGIARAAATIGLSAVFFQDMFGMMTFDRDFEHMLAVRPRTGRNHVIFCLDAYQHRTADGEVKRHGDLSLTIGGHLRNPCLIPVVSDFLFDDVRRTLGELATLNSRHDVVLVLVDSAFAFELPDAPAGWIEAYDVETQRSGLVSRAELRQLGQRVRLWQDTVAQWAKDDGLDVLRLGADTEQNLHSLVEFVIERRLRRIRAA